MSVRLFGQDDAMKQFQYLVPLLETIAQRIMAVFIISRCTGIWLGLGMKQHLAWVGGWVGGGGWVGRGDEGGGRAEHHFPPPAVLELIDLLCCGKSSTKNDQNSGYCEKSEL